MVAAMRRRDNEINSVFVLLVWAVSAVYFTIAAIVEKSPQYAAAAALFLLCLVWAFLAVIVAGKIWSFRKIEALLKI